MRIQLISDVHVEFDRDIGAAFIDSLDPPQCDVLVLAGDITTHQYAVDAIEHFCLRYANKPVLWVHGNHEYYGTSRSAVLALTRTLCRTCPNLRFLDKSIVQLDGRRFLGTTLWYRDEGDYGWNDFRYIKNCSVWLGQEAEDCKKFLEDNLQENDIVISHMLPSTQCIAKPWIRSPHNKFFVHDLTDLIVERKPALWMFGHTHNHVDVRVGATRCVSNPRGYPHEAKLANFDPTRILEV